MAGALVGGSFLSAFLQVLFDRMASPEVLEFFKGQKLNDGLLKKLNATMISVNGLLDDAEEKQITRPAVKKWLDVLKHAVYEAEDLVDEIAYEARQMGDDQVRSSGFLSNLRNPFRNRKNEMVEKLEQVFETLEHLVKQKDALGLKEGFGEKPYLLKIPTTSLVDESGVYGRDDDKDEMVHMLLFDEDDGKKPGVIPIVGMGGVGKTTLTQLVYNDSKVQGRFDVKAWVFVSEEFDVFKITKDILQRVPSNGDAKSPDELQLELEKGLKGKRFLIVLDDVWNDKYGVWDVLMRPLKSGAVGSKILVTTRHESVANMVRTAPAYHLKVLTDEQCWCLFAKHAFDGGKSSSNPELEVIGREVVRKCEGLPLAAKTLGGLLRCERDAKEWEKILKSNIWDLSDDNTLPALRLSYHYLPPHLKRCFSYCAIFQKGFDISKSGLIHMWMAEGFLFQREGDEEMEEIGDKYFRDLVSRSFFQQSPYDISYFTMHDLINDLAKFVSGEFFLKLEGDHSGKSTQNTRHLSYTTSEYDGFKKFEGIHDFQFLRTFYPLPLLRGYYRRIDSKVVNDLLPTLRRLRVLSLSHYCNVAQLPDSIGNLKHLRLLDLSKTSIERLPEIVSTFYYLQTLILSGCEELVELPTNLCKLFNLRCLEIVGTKLQKMPPQIGDLTRLQTMTDFFVGKQSGSSIKELGKLKLLRGNLSIWHLQNVSDAQDALEANLKSKMHLEELLLRWDGNTNDSQHERDILERLCPSTALKYLGIYGYGGTRFPDWVGDLSFSNIYSMVVSGCNYCSTLPPLGQLSSLKHLSIMGCDNVMVIGPEFYGAQLIDKPFKSLESLLFKNMAQWNEWIFRSDDEDQAFPLLCKLSIVNCPNLTGVLPSHLPSLTTLETEGCEQLMAQLPRAPWIYRMMLKDSSRDVLYVDDSLTVEMFPSIDSLLQGMVRMDVSLYLRDCVIRNNDSLKCFPLELFESLYILRLHTCPNLESFSASSKSLYLSSLEIFDCPKFVSFPEGGLLCPKLKEVFFVGCTSLKSLPEHMNSTLPSLVKLEISDCPEIELFPDGGLPSRLESLEIDGSNKLFASRMEWNLRALPTLSKFVFGSCNDVESFPDDFLLPSTLTFLELWNLQSLKSLDSAGLLHLTALKQLKISDCPLLQSIPDEGLPGSVSSLYIYYCPLLEKRCQQGTGEDWPKISHIADIEINLCKIK